MKLYNKIQELINESEPLKQKNNEVLGLAKNELSDLVNTKKAKENLESLKNEFKGYLDGKLIEMPLIVKKNVKELVNKEALTKEIHNEILSQFDKQANSNGLKQEIKNEIKRELDNLLSDRELQNELQQAKSEIISESTNGAYKRINEQDFRDLERSEKNSYKKLEDEAFKKYIFKVI